MSTKVNNMTPCVNNALSILKDLYAHPESKKKVEHLLLAFGSNNGHQLRSNKFGTRCTITGIRPITPNDVNNIKSDALRRKVADFLLNNSTARDTDVLAFTATFGWSENDTFYTTQQHASLSSKSLLTRAAYIAVQKYKEELDAYYDNLRKERQEVKAIQFNQTTEEVNVFELATVKPARKAKTTKSKVE